MGVARRREVSAPRRSPSLSPSISFPLSPICVYKRTGTHARTHLCTYVRPHTRARRSRIEGGSTEGRRGDGVCPESNFVTPGRYLRALLSRARLSAVHNFVACNKVAGCCFCAKQPPASVAAGPLFLSLSLFLFRAHCCCCVLLLLPPLEPRSAHDAMTAFSRRSSKQQRQQQQLALAGHKQTRLPAPSDVVADRVRLSIVIFLLLVLLLRIDSWTLPRAVLRAQKNHPFLNGEAPLASICERERCLQITVARSLVNSQSVATNFQRVGRLGERML